jgi:hypothetical protein
MTIFFKRVPIENCKTTMQRLRLRKNKELRSAPHWTQSKRKARIVRTAMATNPSSVEDATNTGLKRKTDRAVSPESTKKNNNHCHYELQDWKDVIPRNFMGNNPELFCLDLPGKIELIFCDQGLNEGFVQPFTAMYFHARDNDKDGQNKLIKLKKRTKIIAMVPRRASHLQNEPIMKPLAKGETGMPRFKKCYFVRYCPCGSSFEEKQDALKAVAEVR